MALPEAPTVHEKYGVFGRRRIFGLEPFAWDVHSVTRDCHVLDRDAWYFWRDLPDLFVQRTFEDVVAVLREVGDHLLEVLS